MKRLDFIPVLLLLPLLGFVAYQSVDAPGIVEINRGAVVQPTGPAEGRESAAPAATASSGESVPDGDVADVRERLREGEQGTYIQEMLLERDSALARWPDRGPNPLRVWVADGSNIHGWKPSFAGDVRAAFERWTEVGIPVRFTFVVDSADADVHVGWVDSFKESISGKTLWARDKRWWIVSADITLALHHQGGRALDDEAMRAIAMHEAGHLLGLDHTADTTNIMTARVRVRELSDADRATVRLLYSLPAGSIK